ncbi:MAG: DUF5605 domain-containing protein, partial [Oscillospiraceae bacterium]|nr:DUF5605 domain-containing protein [Oscillospiraceae bacterium]
GTLIGSSIERIAFLKDIISTFDGPIEPMKYGLAQYHGYTDEELRSILDKEGNDPFLMKLLDLDRSERDRWLETQFEWAGHCGDKVYIWYLATQCKGYTDIMLPGDLTYDVEVIDTWEMTRETVLRSVSGKVRVPLPAKEYMAVMAVRS